MNRIIKKTTEIVEKENDKISALIENIRKNGLNDDDITSELEKKYFANAILKDIICNSNAINNNFVCIFYKQIDELLSQLSIEDCGYIFEQIIKYNTKLIVEKKDEVVSFLGVFNSGKAFSYAKKAYYRYMCCINISEKEKKEMCEFADIDKKYFDDNYYFYLGLYSFFNSDVHTDSEYKMFEIVLKSLNIPKNLISALIIRMQHLEALNKATEKKEETKKVIVEEIKDKGPSKRQLKEELNNYFKKDEFDFKDIYKLLALMKQLQIPDERYGDYLFKAFNKAIINDDYINFLVDKILFMNENQNIVKALKDQLDLLDFYKKENEHTPCIDEINEIKANILNISLRSMYMYSFDYEIYLNSDRCKQKRA